MPPFRVAAALGAVCALLACGAPPSVPTDAPAAPSGSPGATGAPAADACVQARLDVLAAISELVARHASMRVLAIATVTDMATGLPGLIDHVTHEEVLAVADKAGKRLGNVVKGVVGKL